MNRKFLTKTLIAFTLLVVLMIGVVSCSKEDAVVAPQGSSTAAGVFIDAEVSGLTYQSGDNPPGVTDINGTFEYTPGQPLSFSVGGVQLGTLADGAAVCTPNDFVVPENIARFLQSLDADNDPSNGIDLTAASAVLTGVDIDSSVFEITNSTEFANNVEIANAISTAGKTLLDTATVNSNLREGTVNTFDPAELAGNAFIIVDPLAEGFGFITFNPRINPSDSGATGTYLTFDETVSQGGTGIANDFAWNINGNGVLSIIEPEQSIITATRSGGSSRALSVSITELGEDPRPLTLLKLLPLTETDLCGASVTQGGTFSLTHTVTSSNDSEQITFTADGTLSATGSIDGPWSGTWSVGALTPNSLIVMDGTEWSFAVLLEGSLTEGGTLLIGDVLFAGFDQFNEPILEWQSFFFVSITTLP